MIVETTDKFGSIMVLFCTLDVKIDSFATESADNPVIIKPEINSAKPIIIRTKPLCKRSWNDLRY